MWRPQRVPEWACTIRMLLDAESFRWVPLPRRESVGWGMNGCPPGWLQAFRLCFTGSRHSLGSQLEPTLFRGAGHAPCWVLSAHKGASGLHLRLGRPFPGGEKRSRGPAPNPLDPPGRLPGLALGVGVGAAEARCLGLEASFQDASLEVAHCRSATVLAHASSPPVSSANRAD